MAGFLRKKSKVSDPPAKSSPSRPLEPSPTAASPPTTPLFARFASTQANNGPSNAQKPMVSSPMMLSSHKESSSPTKRHVSAGQPMQYGAVGREGPGTGAGTVLSSFDAEKATRTARSVSAQSPNLSAGRPRIVSSPIQQMPPSRTSNVEKPLPNIIPGEPPQQYSATNRITGMASPSTTPVSPQKRSTSINSKAIPTESRSSIVKPTGVSSNGRRTSTDFSVVTPQSPGQNGPRNLPRKSSNQDLTQSQSIRIPSSNINHGFHDHAGTPPSHAGAVAMPPSAFRPTQNDASSVPNDFSSDDFDLWLKSANAASILPTSTPPPHQETPSPRISRKPSNQDLAPVEQPSVKMIGPPANGPMRGKPLIFSAVANVDVVTPSPPVPPVRAPTNGYGPTPAELAKSYPSPPTEYASIHPSTQYQNASSSFSPQPASVQRPSITHVDNNEPTRSHSTTSPRGRSPASYVSPESPQQQSKRHSQASSRKVSSASRVPESQSHSHRTLTKPRPTTPTKQRPVTPKHRPVTPVSPESSTRKIETVTSPERNNTAVLSAALYDDDPFAKTEVVKMVRPSTASSSRDELPPPPAPKDKDFTDSNTSSFAPRKDDPSPISLSMEPEASRDTVYRHEPTPTEAFDASESIRPSTGSGSVRDSQEHRKAVEPAQAVDVEAPRPVTPPPPPSRSQVPPTPATPEEYRTARTRRRGDKLAVKEVPDAVKSLPVREDRPAEPFPLRLLVVEPAVLSSLLSYLSFYEWCTLLCLCKGIRAALWESPQLKEEVLERYLDTVGYSRWTWPEQEPLTLSLEDLHSYMRGVSLPTHEYARASELVLQARSSPPSERDESVFEKEMQLVHATRAYNRVLLRLRVQAEKEASNPSLSSMSPSSFKGNQSPRYPGSQPSSRAPSPTRSSFSHHHGNGSNNQPLPPLPNFSALSSAGRSPLYRLRRAPLLRVFVPSPEGDWLSDNSVLECEAELKRAGIRSLVRFGDVVWDVAVGDEGNVGRMIWDGKYLVDLDYTYSTVGDLPKYIPALAFPPSYFHRVIRTGPSSSNPIVRMDLAPWGPEIAGNLQLLQDRVRTETPQGSYHNVVRWVHRSSFVIRPSHGGGPSHNGKRSASRTRPTRIPIPDWNNLFVDAGWYGTIVVETEGTNESLADLQDRCGPGAFPPRAAGIVAPKTANGKEREKDSKLVYRILRERRGEQFRHSQNQRRSRAHLSSSTFPRNKQSLPLDLIGLSLYSDSETTESTQGVKPDSESSSSKYSGPAPPKSWTAKRSTEESVTALWRRQALSLIFRGWRPLSDRVLPLTLMCISKILSYATTEEFVDEVLPCIPPHLRLELLRYSAVFAPLCSTRLSALMDKEGDVDGELIVVGPNASLNEEHFRHLSPTSPTGQDYDWDADDPSPHPLRLFALVSTNLTVSTLLSLPPTITHMALIKLSAPILLHRLPSACPLLEVLDLSYNQWLQSLSDETVKSLERLDWGRWKRLRTLGIRECSIPDETIAKVNRGRWDDVEIVQ
ncbi:hypothetical protein PQX77_000766 [Marasmius sp. AFHP31]|nr:hypothetical protein PQX77_000766 [Marasmius sp. AFHP31]